MADVKITELTALTDPVEADIIPIVDDVAGTPTTKKVTLKNFQNSRIIESIVPAANFSLTAGTGVQAAFPTAQDVITLEAESTYFFEGKYFISKSGTTCTTSMLFALSGLTLTSMKYIAKCINAAYEAATSTIYMTAQNDETVVVINATSSANNVIEFSGIIRTNVGGTITPQIQFSATPTTPVMTADSYIRFYKQGTNVENTIGNVA